MRTFLLFCFALLIGLGWFYHRHDLIGMGIWGGVLLLTICGGIFFRLKLTK